MTKAEEKAFEQFVAYIRDNYAPIGNKEGMYSCGLDEEFMNLVYRVNPKSPSLYQIEPFLGVFV